MPHNPIKQNPPSFLEARRDPSSQISFRFRRYARLLPGSLNRIKTAYAGVLFHSWTEWRFNRMHPRGAACIVFLAAAAALFPISAGIIESALRNPRGRPGPI